MFLRIPVPSIAQLSNISSTSTARFATRVSSLFSSFPSPVPSNSITHTEVIKVFLFLVGRQKCALLLTEVFVRVITRTRREMRLGLPHTQAPRTPSGICQALGAVPSEAGILQALPCAVALGCLSYSQPLQTNSILSILLVINSGPPQPHDTHSLTSLCTDSELESYSSSTLSESLGLTITLCGGLMRKCMQSTLKISNA